METATAIEMVKMIRGFTLKSLDGLSEEQMLKIPAGFNNNILWNAGHVLFYTCGFTYGPSGQTSPLPPEYKDLFKANTSPTDWKSTPDSKAVIQHLGTVVDQIAADNAAGKFSAFKPMTFGPRPLSTLQEALTFHCFHEGLHLGRITSLRKLV